jgi:hypothetical protein
MALYLVACSTVEVILHCHSYIVYTVNNTVYRCHCNHYNNWLSVWSGKWTSVSFRRTLFRNRNYTTRLSAYCNFTWNVLHT